MQQLSWFFNPPPTYIQVSVNMTNIKSIQTLVENSIVVREKLRSKTDWTKSSNNLSIEAYMCEFFHSWSQLMQINSNWKQAINVECYSIFTFPYGTYIFI